jgi:hypothetical protein
LEKAFLMHPAEMTNCRELGDGTAMHAAPSVWQRHVPLSSKRYLRFDTPIMHVMAVGSSSHVPPSWEQHVFDMLTERLVALVRVRKGYVWVVSLLLMQYWALAAATKEEGHTTTAMAMSTTTQCPGGDEAMLLMVDGLREIWRSIPELTDRVSADVLASLIRCTLRQ